ncbi:MAG: hypothetical protein J3R72DRAFT_157935 [Linnemannia gamsii]|nr:MAG: hypothetical protein J3R72DRAFT_157935 [Linnemannia gamsii]
MCDIWILLTLSCLCVHPMAIITGIGVYVCVCLALRSLGGTTTTTKKETQGSVENVFLFLLLSTACKCAVDCCFRCMVCFSLFLFPLSPLFVLS